ncbi:MAG: hypothetical protein JJ895_12660 [Balneolaceae bacterium]|nr:hypothetical protein [Balneolaceae bacterium]
MRSDNKILLGVVGIGSAIYVAIMLAGLPWLALGLLLVAAIIFIAILVGNSKAYTNQINTYRIITVVALLLITAHGIRFAFDYSRKDFQKEFLLDIRGTIERGVAKSDIMEKGFYIYRAVQQGEYESITAATDSIIGDRLLENNVYLSDFDKLKLRTPSDKDDDADFFLRER